MDPLILSIGYGSIEDNGENKDPDPVIFWETIYGDPFIKVDRFRIQKLASGSWFSNGSGNSTGADPAPDPVNVEGSDPDPMIFNIYPDLYRLRSGSVKSDGLDPCQIFFYLVRIKNRSYEGM